MGRRALHGVDPSERGDKPGAFEQAIAFSYKGRPVSAGLLGRLFTAITTAEKTPAYNPVARLADNIFSLQPGSPTRANIRKEYRTESEIRAAYH